MNYELAQSAVIIALRQFIIHNS